MNESLNDVLVQDNITGTNPDTVDFSGTETEMSAVNGAQDGSDCDLIGPKDKEEEKAMENDRYKGQKFDLSGFSEYFPFGLKQVYQAATSFN